MKYFKNIKGELYAFREDGTQDHLITDEMFAVGNPPSYEYAWEEGAWQKQTQSIPQSVSRAQGKAALISAGHWNKVTAYVESIEDVTQKALAEVALNDTTMWQRSSPFLNVAAEEIGLSSEQLDQLFLTASQIEL